MVLVIAALGGSECITCRTTAYRIPRRTCLVGTAHTSRGNSKISCWSGRIVWRVGVNVSCFYFAPLAIGFTAFRRATKTLSPCAFVRFFSPFSFHSARLLVAEARSYISMAWNGVVIFKKSAAYPISRDLYTRDSFPLLYSVSFPFCHGGAHSSIWDSSTYGRRLR